MTIGYVDFEVRPSGDDRNGGGFAWDGTGVDYSLQDDAELVLSDVTSLLGGVRIYSASNPFTPDHVGNVIRFVSGTNVDPGFYEVISYQGPGEVTLDRSLDDAVGPVSGGTGRLGGAVATPGGMTLSGYGVGTRIWVRSSTYLLSSATPGPGGPLQVPVSSGVWVLGYGTVRGDGVRATIDANGIAADFLIWCTGGSNQQLARVENFLLEGGGTALRGIRGGSRVRSKFVEAHDFLEYGIYDGYADRCLVTGSGIADFYSLYFTTACLSKGGKTGFSNCTTVACVSVDAALYGFSGGGEHHRPVAIRSGVVGVILQVSNQTSRVRDAVAILCETGFVFYRGHSAQNCYGWGNVKDYLLGGGISEATAQYLSDLETPRVHPLSGDPFVDFENDDFRPNTGPGLVLQGAGLALAGNLAGASDVGATQHADPSAVTYQGDPSAVDATQDAPGVLDVSETPEVLDLG